MTGAHDLTGTPRPWPADLADRWRGCLADAARAESWDTRPSWRGVPALRDALGRLVGIDGVLVTAGIRPLIAPFALLNRRVVVERPSFEGVATAFRRCGVPVLRAGLDEALRLGRPAAEYLLWTTSPWRNPDGWSLGPDDVSRLADFVRQGGILVQNETYRLFTPPTTTTPVRVPGAFLAGSLTKAAGSWSRLGWLLAPDVPESVEAHLRAAAPPTLWQEAWALFAAAGGLDRLGERAAAVGELTARTAAAFGGPAVGGTSVLVGVDGTDPVALLRERYGLLAGSGADFAAPKDTVRLCFLGCGPDCDHRGVEALARSGAARIVHTGRTSGRLDRAGSA